MTDQGAMLNRSLSEVRFGPDCGSVQLYLTDSAPPHGTVVLTCANVLAFHFHRTSADAAPYFLGELTWLPLKSANQTPALARLGYSFLDESGGVLQPNWQATHIHFEGSVCGDIVCRGCSFQEEALDADPNGDAAKVNGSRSSSPLARHAFPPAAQPAVAAETGA